MGYPKPDTFYNKKTKSLKKNVDIIRMALQNLIMKFFFKLGTLK